MVAAVLITNAVEWRRQEIEWDSFGSVQAYIQTFDQNSATHKMEKEIIGQEYPSVILFGFVQNKLQF